MHHGFTRVICIFLAHCEFEFTHLLFSNACTADTERKQNATND